MEDRYLVEPDSKFVREVIDLGGESLKKCFQCGACSVVCALSPDEKPFPRKEMIWAQWGLKDKLMKDPDVWLCHQCTDCSTYCPRGAKPGDVLAAIRAYAIVHFATPGFLARALAAPKYLPAVLAVPALLLFAFLWIGGNLTFPEGEIVLHEFIPMVHGYIGMILTMGFALTAAAFGVLKFWKNVKEFEPNVASASGARIGLVTGFVSSMVDILLHSNTGKCQANRISRFTHLTIFYGFLLLAVSAGIAALFHVVAGISSPYSLTGPVKIIGNAGALLLFIGSTVVIYRRLFEDSGMGNTTYFDWFLILTLWFVTTSGIAVEVLRLLELAAATYWLYLIHLWLIFMLLVYAPFSKGAHLIYRTAAMTYAKQIGRGPE
ncbi:MAG: quinone-interacting membrane-bound oxidoreductase complex subunit QmoC [Chloroflexota bacterium]